MPPDEYAINDLSRLTGLSVRTIRYYLAQGLIPASGETGPGAHYGQGHLDRLRLIKRLQAEYLPNAEIRRRLAPLSDADVAGLVAERGAIEVERPTTTALDYVRGLLGGGAPQDPVAAPARGIAEPMPVHAGTPARMRAAGPAPAAPPPAAPAPAAPAPAAADSQPPERSQWERLQLTDDIELHIRRPLGRPQQRRVERLITIARQVLAEDQS